MKYIKPGAILATNESLADYINQNGIRPGPRKLEQFRQALSLRNTPMLYSQDGKGDDAVVHVKIFDPCGSWTWYLTEWDGTEQAFGLMCGHETELGYVSIEELATTQGVRGIGFEIDTHFKPTILREVKTFVNGEA